MEKMKKMKKCKFFSRDAQWMRERFIKPMDNGKTTVGHWKCDEYGTCVKFGSMDDQFKNRGGFLFCDEEFCRCDYYEPEG